MADKDATDVLAILIIVTVAMFLLFLLTVIILVLRWKKRKTEIDLRMKYLYSSPTQSDSFTRHMPTVGESLYDEVPLNTFSFVAPDEPYSTSAAQGHKKEHQPRHVTPRISTISGRSVDLGNLSGIEEYSLNRSVVPIRVKETYGEYLKRNADSMRSSAGVDLGADYPKAWRIVGDSHTFDL